MHRVIFFAMRFSYGEGVSEIVWASEESGRKKSADLDVLEKENSRHEIEVK